MNKNLLNKKATRLESTGGSLITVADALELSGLRLDTHAVLNVLHAEGHGDLAAVTSRQWSNGSETGTAYSITRDAYDKYMDIMFEPE